mmetsp:Transcript_63276/g.174996  ORF Transcript_63276/g.174996 Transcript_63276/m.174996 type:complete len:208 (-) Transcript_63276:33-656(-)
MPHRDATQLSHDRQPRNDLHSRLYLANGASSGAAITTQRRQPRRTRALDQEGRTRTNIVEDIAFRRCCATACARLRRAAQRSLVNAEAARARGLPLHRAARDVAGRDPRVLVEERRASRRAERGLLLEALDPAPLEVLLGGLPLRDEEEVVEPQGKEEAGSDAGRPGQGDEHVLGDGLLVEAAAEVAPPNQHRPRTRRQDEHGEATD